MLSKMDLKLLFSASAFQVDEKIGMSHCLYIII